MDFIILTNHRMIVEEGEKINIYFDLLESRKIVEHKNDIIVALETVPYGDCSIWKSEESRPFRLQHNYNQLEYLERSWIAKIWFHSDFREIPIVEPI